MNFEIDFIERQTTETSQLNHVPVLSKSLSYNDFFTNYMLPNHPCIIQDITTHWGATTQWLSNESPNLPHLQEKYGFCDVTIYDCNEKYYNSQKTESCKFSEFLKTWGFENARSKYLKDWHLKNTCKEDNFYQVPIFFASDWLNEFLTAKCEDDYRFVYMGQAGTWTPFHADVFNSFSWSANVCGRKRWILFPPGEENFMRDTLNNLPYDISNVYKQRRHFELIQNRGEAIFVPSGWYHQVWNLEDTISVNHNWVNGCNIMNMWSSIENNLNSVKKEIEDCQDMEDFKAHCQIMLKASFGMDFFKFYEFLKFIAVKRLKQVRQGGTEVLFHGHSLGLNHAKFDLDAVKSVLERFIKHEDVVDLLHSEPEQLLQEITEKNIY